MTFKKVAYVSVTCENCLMEIRVNGVSENAYDTLKSEYRKRGWAGESSKEYCYRCYHAMNRREYAGKSKGNVVQLEVQV